MRISVPLLLLTKLSGGKVIPPRGFVCSLGFHAITLERSIENENRLFLNQASVAMNLLLSLFGPFLARGGRKCGNRQTDRRTDGWTDGHTYEPSTVTLAAHARRG